MASSTGRFPIYFFVAWQWKRSIGLGHQHGRRFIVLGHQWPPWCRVKTLYNAQVTNDPLSLVVFVTLAMQPSEVPRSRLSKREHCPQRKRLKNTHVRVSLSCVHVNQKKKKNRKRRHTQCSTEVQSHSVLHLFELFRRLSVYLSNAAHFVRVKDEEHPKDLITSH